MCAKYLRGLTRVQLSARFSSWETFFLSYKYPSGNVWQVNLLPLCPRPKGNISCPAERCIYIYMLFFFAGLISLSQSEGAYLFWIHSQSLFRTFDLIPPSLLLPTINPSICQPLTPELTLFLSNSIRYTYNPPSNNIHILPGETSPVTNSFYFIIEITMVFCFRNQNIYHAANNYCVHHNRR